MERSTTVELGIRDRYNRFPYMRAALDIADEVLLEACMPIKSNSDPTFDILEGQGESERSRIREARQRAAKAIGEEIAEYVERELFSLNDTHNGYKE